MRSFVPGCVLLLVLNACLVSPACAGSIGLYVNADATGNSLELQVNEVATIHAVANTDASDPFDGEFVAGNFRIVGLPEPWVANVTPAQDFQLVLGNPLQEGVDFSRYPAMSGTVPLFAITVVALTPEHDVVLEVVRHVRLTVAWGFVHDCPWLLHYCPGPCDIPGTCVDATSLTINPTVAVESAGWSAVKRLYR